MYIIFVTLNSMFLTSIEENIQSWICRVCSRKNFKSLFRAGIVLVVGVLNLYISSNENDWCHSARVTSPGNIKGHANYSRPLFASSLASSRTDQATWESTFPLFTPPLLAVGRTILFLSHHRESTMHYEESTFNLWTIGVWEIIL